MTYLQGDVTTLVQDKFETSMDYADLAFNQAIGLINELSSTTVTLDYSEVDLAVNQSSVVFDNVNIPGDIVVVESEAVAPTAPNFSSEDIEEAVFTTISASSPALQLPEVPVLDEYTLPTTPALTTVTSVAGIEITERTAPTLTSVTTPTAPSLTTPDLSLGSTPSFSGSLIVPDFDPNAILAEMSNVVVFFKAELNVARNTIIDFIENPQMAMGDTVTEQIRNAALQKIADEYAPRYVEVNTFYSSRGWNIPQGINVARVNELDRLRTISEDNVERDLAIKNFELSQQNMLAAFQMLPQYTNSLVSASSAILNQVIEVAKYTFEAALLKYRAAYEVYKTQVEVYKTAVAIYQLKVESQKLLVEMYNVEVTSAKLQVEVNSNLLNMFKLQVEIENTKLQAHKLEIENMLAQITQNKAVIDLYRAQIEGYAAGLAANNSKIQVYTGQIAGEESKVKLYGAQVQAHSAIIETEKTQALIAIENAKTKIENNRATASVYESSIKGYSAALQAELSTNEINAKLFASQVGLYEASVKANAIKSEIDIKEKEVNARMREASAQIDLKNSEINMHNMLTQAQIQIEAIKGAAAVAAQLSASSMSAVSAGANLSAQSQISENWNYDVET